MKTKPELVTFKNGLRILCDFMPERESVALGIWVKTGSRYENSRNQGISHFLEHMLFKGTAKRSGRQISRLIEGRGGTLNGFTTEECTCYWAKVRGDRLGEALDILLDLAFHPKLDEEEIEKEKGVVKEEIRMYRDNPAYHVHQLLQEDMWPGQALGRSILGSEITVGNLRRKDLSDYRSGRYLLRRMAVVACGNLRPEQVLKEVERRLPEGERGKAIMFRPAHYTRAQNPLNLEERETEQVHLSLGLEGLPRLHPGKYALSLLNIVLGGNMSSRLFQEIREKRGWVYSIRSELDFYQDTGALVITAGLPARRLEGSLRLIRQQLEKLSDQAPGLREFKRAREYYLGQMALSLEKTVARMLWLGTYLICTDKVINAGEVSREINRLHPGDLRRVAQKLFRLNKLCLALIGPLKQDDVVRSLSRIYG
jgi:predicted Zn-dependent peptidase